MRAVVTTLLITVSVAYAGDPEHVSFVACPIYRDTDAGRKSGCWLADDFASGKRYDVSAAPMKPQLGRQVLVEGIVSGDDDACGGVTLRPVRTSQLDATCDGIVIPAENFPGRRFDLPADVLQPTWVPRPVPPPPYALTEYQIFFDFNSSFLVYQHSEIVFDRLVTYANAAKAKQVQVTGYAAVKPITVSGQVFSENKSLARARAEVVSESLRRLGIDPAIIQSAWQIDPEPVVTTATSTAETGKRRVTIRVVPGEKQ